MRFDLTDLRLFLNVFDAGTITAGAERSHLTLASASERIRGMEEALGTALLLRERRGVCVTPAGRALVRHARLVLDQVERMHDELGEYGVGLKGQIRLLCNTTALSEHLPEALGSFLARHGGISIDLEERASVDIVDALRLEHCDLGIVADSADLAGLEVFALRPDPLVLVVARDHPLAAYRSIGFVDIIDHPFIGLGGASALQQHLAQQARRLGKRMNLRIRLRGFESVCRLVGLGIGVGIVPRAVADRCARAAGLKRLALSDPWAKRNLVLCTRRLADLPAPAQRLAEHLLEQAPHAP